MADQDRLSTAELARRRAMQTPTNQARETEPPASGAELVRRARALPGDPCIGGMVTDADWQPVCTLRGTDQPAHAATIYVQRMPAMFWRITGDGADLSTGSGEGMPELALMIAEAIAAGVLGATDHTEGSEQS
jgi:hypothetical protein